MNIRKSASISVLSTIIIISFSASPGFGFTKVGTTSAPFLKIEYGARAVAMGGSFVALADDASGTYYNPAGIAELDNVTVCVGHTMWFADLDYNYATFVIPTKKINVSLWGAFLSSEDIPVTTVENPDGTGQFFHYLDGVLGITGSAFLSDRLSIGLSLKFVQQTLYNESASTFALDIGSILRTPFKGLRLGMCMTNYGGRMQLSGNDLIVQTDPWPEYEGNPDVDARLSTESYPLPLAFKLGIALDVLGDRALLNHRVHRLTVAVDGIHPNDGKEKYHLGFEYCMYKILFLRAGYKINYDTQKYTVGAGMKISIAKRIVCADYAFVDMDVLDATHRFSLTVGF
jgi:hypothetical protein